MEVTKAKKPGRLADGGGLYLSINHDGNKSWVYRYMLGGRSREMGLGSFNTIGLREARDAARDCRKLCRDGIDPIEQRRVTRGSAALDAGKARTFKECTTAYVEAHRAAWKSAKHADQWLNTMTTYAFPVLGKLAAGAVDTPHVLKVLEPIWAVIPETASRVRGRVEAVLDWATARGFRKGANPARWKGHLKNLLASPSKIQKTKHHAALPYAEVGAFMLELRSRPAMAAVAMRFTILTAARTGETIGAPWREIAWKEKLWVIPAERMKGDRPHRVPLGKDALAILRELRDTAGGKPDPDALIFPGSSASGGLSNMALLKLLERMDRPDITTHGFRSSFRDWVAEKTDYPRELAEIALAHIAGDEVETAYQRSDLLERRRALMEEWAAYCKNARLSA